MLVNNVKSPVMDNNSTLKSVYQELVNKFISYHLYFNKLSIFCDMLRLHCFKRWFEYMSLDYLTKQKGLTRHAIDCFCFTVFPTFQEAETMQGMVNFQEVDPTKVDASYRSNMIKEILGEVKTLELSCYDFLTKKIQQVASTYPTEVVNLTNIAKCVSKNIYELNRTMGHYNAFGYDNKFIEHEQEIGHNLWEEKTKSEFYVNYC